jgi:AcrR family transcriptional regulator
MPKKQELNRRERILDAATQVFADFGFEGASMRDIVAAADVNLATVYYHFQSKEGLMAAVFERLFRPLQEEHLRLFHEFEAQVGGKPIPVERILEAIFRPPLRLVSGDPARSLTTSRLIGRIVTDPDPRSQELLRRQHKEVRDLFLGALRRSLPGLSEPALRWRLEFAWGSLAFILCNPARVEIKTEGICNPSDTGSLLAHLVSSFAASFRAPAPTCFKPGPLS